MLRYLILLFMLCPFGGDLVYGQIARSMSVEFTQITIKGASREAVKGNIYYQAPKRVVLKVTEPVYQWMVLERNTMLIYYPNEQKAFRFSSENPFSLPFFQAFVGVLKDDFGLSEAGFTLARNEMKEDTLLTYWKPPKQAKNILGNTMIGLARDRLVFVEVQDAKGKTLVKTTYRNHFQYGEVFFPLEIASVQYQGSSSIIEEVTYANPQFNVTLPQEIVDFRIPLGIEVKEIEW